ncbi:MAG: Neocarzinostatin family, partial [Actinomycetota bacterium]|nr:Neocarzinostatin family [Actinomycetota bacterium]
MNRRQWSAAIVVALTLVGLTLAGWGPAAGNTPEGGDTGFLNVTPSDDLPPNSVVAVSGTGFSPGATVGTFVDLSQCVSSLEDCGPVTQLPIAGDATFSGTMVVVRYLTLTRTLTTVDCADLDASLVSICPVQASGGGFASHHLTFSTVVPTTSTVPKTTIVPKTTTPPPTNPLLPTTTTLAPRPPQPGVTIPPTTKAQVTTTTVRPTTTSSTTAPPTTTTTVAPPADDRPTLIAVTQKNEPSGPPGGGLHVQGSGYTCPMVYFFFDGTRVGSDTPDAAGNVSESGLSVPGNAGKGAHRVTSSCEASGASKLQASTFEVLPVSVHR